MKYFDLEVEAPSMTTEALRRDFLAGWTGALGEWGYKVTSQSEVGVTFHRRYRSLWLAIPVIFLFPIGLLFLLWTSDATITATVEPDDDSGGAVLMINGNAPRGLRRNLERLTV